MHLRLTMILRVDARSATAQENTSHVVTRSRMVGEHVVAFTDPGSFWYSGAAASLLLDGGLCSMIEHQQDQLMYQQEVIDEAGAARTPVPQYAQEYRGKPVDLRIGNELETLAVDEKLCAELADVEANQLMRLMTDQRAQQQHGVPRKHSVSNWHSLRFSDTMWVMLHSDQEPVLVQLLRTVQNRRPIETSVRYGPRISHQSQSKIKNANQASTTLENLLRETVQ